MYRAAMRRISSCWLFDARHLVRLHIDLRAAEIERCAVRDRDFLHRCSRTRAARQALLKIN